MYSLAVTGKSDKYWTAACLDDDFFDEEPRLASDDETMELVGTTDPILLKAEAEDNFTKSPRAYALAALAVAFSKTVEHHGNIQDWFKASLSLLVSFLRTTLNNTLRRLWDGLYALQLCVLLTDTAGIDRLPMLKKALSTTSHPRNFRTGSKSSQGLSTL